MIRPRVTEKQVQRAITDLLKKQLGFACYNLSQPRATKQSFGLPDLIAIGRGLILFIECKRPGGKQTEYQKQFQREVEANGGTYCLWSSAKQAWDYLTERHFVENEYPEVKK